MNFNLTNVEDHSRTIIHIDLDCFYAQVEMIKNPALCNIPLGIQQKHIVVTSNYIAREFGVTKCMTVSEALKVCPQLHLVKGEDLHDYRQISYKVTNLLQKYSSRVERLGLDENYVDVSNLVNEKLKNDVGEIEGHVFGATSELCQCGCQIRLKVGTHVAKEIRDSLKSELNLTSCAGIAHNKLLAKLCGAKHKPNQQTVVFPYCAVELILSLKYVTNIPGIGRVAGEQLKNLNINTIEDLQNCDLEQLKSLFGSEKSKTMWHLSFGHDPSPVKQSGKPLSIGLEDSCKALSVEAEIHSKFQQLLSRLMVLVAEDGRIPRTIKLTVRKYDYGVKVAHRETKQCNINSNLFNVGESVELSKDSEKKLMKTIMLLFTKIVDIKKPFHVTLIGLSFTKFQERPNGSSSITTFLKKNVEVQSLTNIENKKESADLMDYTESTQHEFNTDGSESELEPSPKKTKLSSILVKRRCIKYNSTEDLFSPSKLKVAELRLNSKDLDNCEVKQEESPGTSNATLSSSDSNQNIPCPPDVDKDVFKELPPEVQQELWEDHIQRQKSTIRNQIKKPKVNTILNYLVKNP